MPRHLLVEAAACKSKVGKFTASVLHILPEGPDNDEEVGGDAHVAANEAAVDAQVEGCIPCIAWVVVADCEDELDAVVDEGDCCQHDPGNQQASLALWRIIFDRIFGLPIYLCIYEMSLNRRTA